MDDALATQEDYNYYMNDYKSELGHNMMGITGDCSNLNIDYTDESLLRKVLDNKNLRLSTKSIFALHYLVDKLENGEIRPQQILLIYYMSNIISNHNDGLLEAGTGVGKSIAYLIPSIINGKKCFVSTSTKQLTSQLVHKDLPLLKKYLFPDLEFSGLQSLSNFICPKKLDDLWAEHDEHKELFEKTRGDDYKQMKKAQNVYDAYLADSVRYDEMTTDKIGCSCDSFLCAGSGCVRACKYKDKDNCPVFRLVNQIIRSNVVVTNHAFVSRMLVDASRDESKSLGILSGRYLWICDEVHDLEGYAENAFSSEISNRDFRDYVDRMTKYINSGLITTSFKLKHAEYMSVIHKMMPEPEDSMIYHSDGELRDDLVALGQLIGNTLKSISDKYESQAKELLEMRNNNGSKPVMYIEGELKFTQKEIETIGRSIDRLLMYKAKLETFSSLEIKYIPSIRKIIDNVLETFKTFYRASFDTDSYITYYRYEQSIDYFKICSTFLKPGEAIQSGLGYLDLNKSDLTVVNKNKINLIGLSATIKTDNKFNNMADKLGLLKLDGIGCECYDIGTVFNFREQGLLYIPSDIPDVKNHRVQQFEYFKRSITELIEYSNGGALILCTTKGETFETYKHLSNYFKGRYTVLSADDKKWQGKSKDELVEVFRNDRDSILVGTRGFFQGLDIQGDSLRLLCLNKIPFHSEDIVSKRKNEIATAKGLDAFQVNGVAPAIMLLLQAIGRLIRHTSDKGVVVIYDDRLYSGKPWIAPVLRSIPDFKSTRDINEVKEFFNNMNV